MGYLQIRSLRTDLNVPVIDPVPTHLLADIPDQDAGLQLKCPVPQIGVVSALS